MSVTSQSPSHQAAPGLLPPPARSHRPANWPYRLSKVAIVTCFAAALLLAPGGHSRALAQGLDNQPAPIWSIFDALIAKCIEIFNPAPAPSNPVPPPPDVGPGPVIIPPVVILPPIDMGPGPGPIITPPIDIGVGPGPIIIPPTDTVPGPGPNPVVAVPGPIAGAGLPALLVLGVMTWFRRRKAKRTEGLAHL